MMATRPPCTRSPGPIIRDPSDAASPLATRQPDARTAGADAFGAVCFAAFLVLSTSFTESAVASDQPSSAFSQTTPSRAGSTVIQTGNDNCWTCPTDVVDRRSRYGVA